MTAHVECRVNLHTYAHSELKMAYRLRNTNPKSNSTHCYNKIEHISLLGTYFITLGERSSQTRSSHESVFMAPVHENISQS